MIKNEVTAGAVTVWVKPLLERAHSRPYLMEVLSCYLGCLPNEVPLQVSPQGKPFLPKDYGVHFSVSHAGTCWVVAVANQAVGVDIECPVTRVYSASIIDRYWSEPEKRWYLAQADKLNAFYKGWTAREACSKYWGVGVYKGLSCMQMRDQWVGYKNEWLPVTFLNIPGKIGSLVSKTPMHIKYLFSS